MPTYEYRCEDCGHGFDVVQGFAEAPLTTCDVCGGTLRKVFAPVGIVFKGSGFYKNDSRSSGAARSNGSPKEPSAKETATETSTASSDAPAASPAPAAKAESAQKVAAPSAKPASE